MAVIIPDLFGAFQKGREYAIDRNWKDLENYETIEKMRTANDMAQLALLQERYYTPLKMSMFADNADNSAMQNQIQFTAFPGALSNARQFTNQAISNEGVQATTINDTAQANIAAITGNNAKTKAQGAIDVAQANNTDTGLVGKARADVVNEKARNALANIKIEQDIFNKSSEEKLLAINNSIESLKNIQELQPLLNQIENLKYAGKYNEALTYLIQAKGDYERAKIQANEGGYASVGANGNGAGITSPNIDYTKATDTELGRYEGEELAILNNPNSTPMQKAMAKRRLNNIYTESGRRGYPVPQTASGRQTGWGTENVSPNRLIPQANQKYSFNYNTVDEQGRPSIDYTAGLVGQGQQAGVGVRTNPTNYTGKVGNTNLLGDLNKYIDPANFTYNSQDLSGGGQPPQTQATNLVGGDINAHLESVRNDNSLSKPLQTAKLFAGGLERDSSQYNNWGGIFGEKDQPVRNILINGVEIPISNQTLDMLNSLNTNALTFNQLLIKNALLNNRAIQKTEKNGRVEFVPNQLIPMSYNSYSYPTSNPLYR